MFGFLKSFYDNLLSSSEYIPNSTFTITVKYIKYGYLFKKTSWKNKKKHAVFGPAETFYYPSGSKKSEWYYQNGKLFRESGPKIVKYSELGEVE